MQSAPPAIIFQGSPSQAVNAPFFLLRAIYALALTAAFHYLRYRWPSPFSSTLAELLWAAFVITSLVVLLSVVKRYIKVASTVYTIDQARITIRHGIATKVIASLELFRVMDVTFVQSWWEGILGIGTIDIDTSDNFHPRLRMVGMDNAERLRASLNQAAVELRQSGGYREVAVGRS